MLSPEEILLKTKVLVSDEESSIREKILKYAKQNYDTYNFAVGGVAWNGDPLPSWEDFYNDPTKQKQVFGWVTTGFNSLFVETKANKEAVDKIMNHGQQTNAKKN